MLIAVMCTHLFITLLLVLCVSTSVCLGQDTETQGRLLVVRYLSSVDADEREDVLRAIERLGAGYDRVAGWVKNAADYAPVQPGLHRKVISVGESKGEYFVYIPSSYAPDRSWPAVVMLHGVGGSGFGQAMAWLKASAHNDEFIFIAPTYASGLWWEDEAENFVLSVLDRAKKEYNINTNRVYLTGFSSGGHGAWYMAIRHPGIFAAINPIAGECPLPELLVNLAHVSVYIIHGAEDDVISVEAARDASSRLAGLGYNFVYKELPGLRHTFPGTEAGDVPKWFRAHERPLFPRRITFSTESARYSVSYWIEVTEFSAMVGQVAGVPDIVYGRPKMPEGFPETATVTAEIREGNEIYLNTQGVNALRLYLGGGLIDVEAPLRVYINGRSAYWGKVDRSLSVLLDAVRKRNDREALFSACLDLKVSPE